MTLKSVWALIKQTASNWTGINAPRLGAALAFYTMLSIAPLVIVCIGIVGLVFGPQAAQGRVMEQLQGFMGSQRAETVQALVQNAARPASGIVANLIGIFVLLFGASGVFGELRDSLNMVWGAKETGPSGLVGMIRYRFVSFAMVLGVGFLLLVSLLLSAVIAAAGHFVGGYLPVGAGWLELVNLVFSFAVVTVLFALLYKLVPDVKVEWQDVWIGAAATSLLFSIGKFLIGIYIGRAAPGSAYGAAGSLVVFLLWVYYSAQIFFVGAEFTHAFAERHGSRARARLRAESEPVRHPRVA